MADPDAKYEFIVSCPECGDQVAIKMRLDRTWTEERIAYPIKCSGLHDQGLKETQLTNFICPNMHKAISEAAANYRKRPDR
jgi:predicted RNA-binding Zn-ribbon protein involved in translation (DUF1610 family)